MSNSDPSTEYEESFEALDSSHDRYELKNILEAIATQLNDADRRHSATLSQMQDRIAGMGREAETMRRRVPEAFAPAFQRIEAGMAELVQRLAEPGSEGRPQTSGILLPHLASRDRRSDMSFGEGASSETPMALRSAGDTGVATMRRRDDEPTRRGGSAVDTFDVIESSLPGDASEPWDSQSAKALSELYETGFASVAPRLVASVVQQERLADSKPSIDHVWLEDRFNQIAKGIEASLAGIRPDQGFNALGQRFDGFEQTVSKMFEGVAAKSDVSALRLIEAHVSEVVDHLVHTQEQLARLSVIEDQIRIISSTLSDVQGAQKREPSIVQAAPPVDVDAIARAAVEKATQRFTEIGHADRNAAADQLRPLIERLIADNRQGEENTAALLDTLQQAMIHLIDRVESIESGQRHAADAPALPPNIPLNSVAHDSVATVTKPDHVTLPAVDEAPAVAPTSPTTPQGPSVEAVSKPHEHDGANASHSSDRQRHDLIAEVRRAKQRLAESEKADAIIVATPNALQMTTASPTVAASTAAISGTRPVRTPAAAPKISGPSAPSPRLIAVAVAAIAALAGLWYSLDTESDQPVDARPLAGAPAKPMTDTTDVNSAPGVDVNGKRGENAPPERTEGKVVPTVAPAGITAMPMLGVAVDLDQPMSKSALQTAQRHQAMATMSGEIGAAAARSSDPATIPASMVPSERDTAVETSAPKSQPDVAPPAIAVARSTGHEMPPATVGPLSLRLAAANGDPSAEFEVGARFAEGKGIKQSFNDAAKWYQRSADAGFAQAQYRLGTLYERGLGLKPDSAQAAEWYQRAAEQGNIKAMHNLAVLSANQKDQSPDYVTAAHWFEEAAKRDLPDSQFNLAVLYENGLGVKRDMKLAFMWLSLAARNNDGEAVRRRDILRGKLTADELAAAQRMTSQWKSVPYDRNVNDARTAGEAWKKNPKNNVSG